jgi:hypothetical protein
MLPLGTSVGLEELPETVRLPAAVSASPTVNERGPVEEPALMDRLAMLEIVGAVFSRLFTRIELFAVVELPAASRATALNVCVPFAIVVVFQVTPYGALVSSAPRFAPSTLNCTPTTPRLSDALADTVTVVPLIVAPIAGALTETEGGVVSLLLLLPYR